MAKNLPRQTRRKQILEAAIAEFVEKGYDSSTMDGIANRAGVSKGAVYHHFTSKNEVLISANQYLNEPIQQILAEVFIISDPEKILCDYIHRYCNYWKDKNKEMLFVFLSFTRIFEDPKLFEEYKLYYNSIISLFEDLYKRGIERGVFKETIDPEQMAVALISAIDGLLGIVLLNTDHNMDAIIKTLQKLFIRNVLK